MKDERYDYYEEMAEITEEQWDFMLEWARRDAFKEYMTADPVPDHTKRNAILIVIVTSLLFIAGVLGALIILQAR